MAIDLEYQRYDHSNLRDRAFVLRSFVATIREQPIEQLADESVIIEARTLIATPAGYPDDLLAWISVGTDAIIFAYVKYIARRRGIFRQMIRHVAQEYVPLPLAYWTRSCSRIAKAGKLPLFHDLDAYAKLTKGRHEDYSRKVSTGIDRARTAGSAASAR